MRFIDNWCYALTAPLSAGGSELPVPAEAITRLGLAVGDEYVLCGALSGGAGLSIRWRVQPHDWPVRARLRHAW